MLIMAMDDEELQLKGLLRAIGEAEPEAEVVSFSRSSQAAKALEGGLRPDVCFLDIEMPGINGVEMAKRIKLLTPRSNIIFVTGFSEYAVDAAGLHASGYVMKPVTAERIRAEMDDLRCPVAETPPLPPSQKLSVQTFGNFEVFVRKGTSLAPLDFKSAKAKELFALLIDRKGSGLTTAEIAAYLWEDREYSISTKNQVQKAISRIRAVLAEEGFSDVLVKNRNNTGVNIARVDCDLYKFMAGDVKSINAFTGEYMAQYSWAEFTAGFLSQQVFSGR